MIRLRENQPFQWLDESKLKKNFVLKKIFLYILVRN